LRVQGLRLRVEGLVFRVQGLGSGVQGSGLRVQCSGIKLGVEELRFMQEAYAWRGTSLIRSNPHVGTYRSPMPRDL